MADLTGKILDRRYRVVAKLGRGGMAEVYKADQPSLGRYVAIKVLHSHLIDDEDFIGRFSREAKAIGRLRHPNIVQAFEFNGAGETYYLAMEYIDGPSLKDEIRARKAAGQPFNLKEIGRIFGALCSAIDYAHARNMVHRDLKPANVMINEEGQIVLTDFGIARVVGATQYTQTGALSGTPAYMSPEQGRGERGDKRSDIYSLGIMLYEMVTGTVPFDADTPFAVIMKHISEPLPRPSQVDPNIPEAVEHVILKAMAKEPDDRYQSAGEMAQALREAVGLAPGDTLLNTPLTVISGGPQVQEIDHPTGPITEAEIAATSAAFGRDGATVVAQSDGATTVTLGPGGGLPTWLIYAGGGLIVILVIAVIAGGFALRPGNGAGEATVAAQANATETSSAQQTATSKADVNSAAEAATAALLAPTQTAVAAVTLEAAGSATAAAEATREANFVNGALSAVAATTTAIAEAQAATAEAATATALANTPPTPTPTETPTPAPPTETPPPAPPRNTPVPAAPTEPPPPQRPPISGKLAFPVDNGSGQYDINIVSLPDGAPLGTIRGARQPNFRPDGGRLIVNGQGGGFGEDVWEFDTNGNPVRPVSSSPSDSHPVYNPYGDRIAYGNPQLAIGSDGNYHSYIFVQCSTIPPSQESDKCQNIAEFGVLVPAGQIGEIQGSNPVWAADDHIFYKGCNSWAGGGSCGMFTVGSWGSKQFSNGETPRKIADGTSLTPTDTKGNLVAFHGRETGNWEAFVMDLSGAGVVNISNSPANDGLPTLSPDGQWVAFASDREGNWAVFVTPSSGGAITKLFDFPKANPWGAGGDRSFDNERMSWGP